MCVLLCECVCVRACGFPSIFFSLSLSLSLSMSMSQACCWCVKVYAGLCIKYAVGVLRYMQVYVSNVLLVC